MENDFTTKMDDTKIILCLAICVGVLPLIWCLICGKWVWNNKVLGIWLTLRHIRKIALLKNPKKLTEKLSTTTRMVFYLVSCTKSIPKSANCCGMNPKLAGSFSDAFPCIQPPRKPRNPPPCKHAEALAPMSSKGKVTLELMLIRSFELTWLRNCVSTLITERWGKSITMTNAYAYCTWFWKARTAVTRTVIGPC